MPVSFFFLKKGMLVLVLKERCLTLFLRKPLLDNFHMVSNHPLDYTCDDLWDGMGNVVLLILSEWCSVPLIMASFWIDVGNWEWRALLWFSFFQNWFQLGRKFSLRFLNFGVSPGLILPPLLFNYTIHKAIHR